MPRFYVNLRSGGSTTNDDQGIECATLEDARKMALGSARELLADNIKSGSKTPVEAVIITSESGQELVEVRSPLRGERRRPSPFLSDDEKVPPRRYSNVVRH